MNSTERNILNQLHDNLDNVPTGISNRDTGFITVTTKAVLRTIIDADEPANKTKKYHEHAQKINAGVKDFIAFREKENWIRETDFKYFTIVKLVVIDH